MRSQKRPEASTRSSTPGPHVPQKTVDGTPAELQEQLDADASGFFAVAHRHSTFARPKVHRRRDHGGHPALSARGLSSIPGGGRGIDQGIAAEEGRFGVRANTVGLACSSMMAERLMASGDLDESRLMRLGPISPCGGLVPPPTSPKRSASCTAGEVHHRSASRCRRWFHRLTTSPCDRRRQGSRAPTQRSCLVPWTSRCDPS